MRNNLSSIYKGKNIFLTGHTGFKGSWMSVWLEMLGANVKGYALKPEKKSLYNQISKSLSNHHSIIGDIRNHKSLERELLEFQPDFIFHFAAQPLVRYSYKKPIETFETNVMGTVNLLEASRKLNKRCSIVCVTTDKVYHNIEKKYAYNEEDKLGGYDPYSASKAASEIVIESYRLSFFNANDFKKHKIALASARAGNVIGGGDYAEDRIVPDLFRGLSKSETVIVRNPDAVRPWQHVLESLYGYLLLGTHLYNEPKKFSLAYNFGPNKKDVSSVASLVKSAIATWGNGFYKTVKPTNAPHEAGHLMLDNSKAKKMLSWQPKWNAKQTIEKTMMWYKRSLERNCNVEELCKRDIKEYLKDDVKTK